MGIDRKIKLHGLGMKFAGAFVIVVITVQLTLQVALEGGLFHSKSEKLKHTGDQIKSDIITNPDIITIPNGIHNVSSRRVLIFALKQQAPNMKRNIQTGANFWGLGDMVRGIIRCFQLAKKYDYKFVIDVRHHPVSKVLHINKHGYENITDYYIGSLNFTLPEKLESTVKANTRQVLLVLTNGLLDGPGPDQECKTVLKQALSFQQVKNQTYDIVVHVRLGDGEMTGKGTDRSKLSIVLEKLKKVPQPALLLSDSDEIKKHAKSMGFSVRNYLSHHFGLAEDIDSHYGIMNDFTSLASAKVVYLYSSYGWRSGFVTWGSALGQAQMIPLLSL